MNDEYEKKWSEAISRHNISREKGWVTNAEARRMSEEQRKKSEGQNLPAVISNSRSSGRPDKLSSSRRIIDADFVEVEEPKKPSDSKSNKKPSGDKGPSRKIVGMKGPTIKIPSGSKSNKQPSGAKEPSNKQPSNNTTKETEKPIKAEIVDEEMEAARKKGYDARMKEKRQRQLVEAEKQGRRQAMTFRSKIREDVTPMAKRVAKKAGKIVTGLAKELAATPAQIAQTMGQTAIAIEKEKTHRQLAAKKAETTKRHTITKAQAQTQRKEKPTIATRKGTLGRKEGGLPVKSKGTLGKRQGTITKVQNGPTNNANTKTLGRRSGYKPPHKSNKPAPTNNTQRGAPTVRSGYKPPAKRSVNFAMRKRSRR